MSDRLRARRVPIGRYGAPRVQDFQPVEAVDVRLMRYRLVEEAALLAATADQQIGLLQRKNGYPIMELALGFWDWSERVPQLREAGAISDAAVDAVDRVSAALLEVDRASAGPPGTPYLWTEEALRTDNRWTVVRAEASLALAAFADLGVPPPSVDDPAFWGPRDDAP